MEDKRDLDDLLERFFSNRTTPEESALVRQWLVQLDLSDEQVSDQRLAAIKAAMYQRIIAQPSTQRQKQRSAIRRMASPLRWTAAASVILLLGIGARFFFARPKPSALPIASLIKEVNNDRSVRHLQLKDGTDVWLNSHSSLTWSADFNEHDRTVRLEGEGFFQVVQDSHRPFTVMTDNVETRVLGTSFNIESYPDESEIRVSLATGKVGIEDSLHPAGQLILTPNQSMRYARKERNWEKIPLDLTHVKDWTTGSIVFNEVPLAEALHRIAVRYNIKIQYLPETVAGKRVTTVIKDASWPSVLSDILFVHHLEYRESNGVIWIK